MLTAFYEVAQFTDLAFFPVLGPLYIFVMDFVSPTE